MVLFFNQPPPSHTQTHTHTHTLKRHSARQPYHGITEKPGLLVMSPEHFAFVGTARNPLLARVCWVRAQRNLTGLWGHPTPTGRDCFVCSALFPEDAFAGQCGHVFQDVPHRQSLLVLGSLINMQVEDGRGAEFQWHAWGAGMVSTFEITWIKNAPGRTTGVRTW
ncbi:hypothetical protein HJG60_009616 [Phyllostomus discolor]|uniref:Uncharacterized protein n=1 Tax=Phyllostomus discolor TaxID=89673 RepID=A0A833YGW2_9CHIR|nr:hypothetical protein HJG60_009616 [Phyllostomus discolor]